MTEASNKKGPVWRKATSWKGSGSRYFASPSLIFLVLNLLNLPAGCLGILSEHLHCSVRLKAKPIDGGSRLRS